jgi:hypothetical protein
VGKDLLGNLAVVDHGDDTHLDPFQGQEFVPDQQVNDFGAKQFFQPLDGNSGEQVERAVLVEQPIRDQSVKVRVKIQILAKGVNRYDESRGALGQTQAGAEEVPNAFVSKAADAPP